jgi:hypothetical protein
VVVSSLSRAFALAGAFALACAMAGLAGAGCGRTDFDPAGRSGAGGASNLPTGLPQLPPTPGLFVCVSTVCQTSSQQCCVTLSAAGAASGTCMPLGASCPGLSLQCDEPADCAAGAQGQGNVCCAGVGASTAATLPLSIGSVCVPAARCTGTGQVIVCRQDSDCHGTGVCCAGDGLPTCLPACPKI